MGCRALVFGGSSGVGYYSSRSLARRGCPVVIAARRLDRLRSAAERLREETGGTLYYVRADLTVPESIESSLESAREMLGGGIDVVIASYGNPSREPLELHEASWSDWVEASKLYLASTAMILKWLVTSNTVKSTFIGISSFTVVEPMPPLVVSDTVRAGLSRLARIASRRYPDKVRPLILLLGSIDTPGARETIRRLAERRGEDPDSLWRREVEGLSPLRRTCRPEELERVVAWLAIDSPEYLTGSTILFDGASLRTSYP